MSHNAGKDRHNNLVSDAAIEQRRETVGANVLAGLTYREIAKALNVSAATVSRDMQANLKHWKESRLRVIDDLVALEMRRIDIAMNALWDKIKAGDTNAIGMMIKLQEQAAKFQGLYAPERHELTGANGQPIKTTTTLEGVSDDLKKEIILQAARRLNKPGSGSDGGSV